MPNYSTTDFTIDGVPMLHRAAPSSISDLQDVIRSIPDAIYPLGGGLSLDYGFPPSRPGLVLDTTNLNRVVDYPSEDMTITVEAGIRIADLQRILAEKGQTLPIDAGSPEQATLGGLIATNASGPRRYGYGTLRDYVIGIDVVDATGRRVHGGGRVVKNVAGYDLMKMHTGALGSLGVIVQVSLKLKPIQAAREMMFFDAPPPVMEEILERINRSQTRPVALELIAAERIHDKQPTLRLFVLFEESLDAVVWQNQQLVKELKSVQGSEGWSFGGRKYEGHLDGLNARASQSQEYVTFKASVLPSQVCAFISHAETRFPNVFLTAHAGNGIVRGSVSRASFLGKESLKEIVALADAFAGSVIIEKCPEEWKIGSPIWGKPRPDWKLMRQLKSKLDPQNRLNPGRWNFEEAAR